MLQNKTCEILRLASRFRTSMEVALKNVSRDCVLEEWGSLCSGPGRGNCTVAFLEKKVKLYTSYIEHRLTMAYERRPKPSYPIKYYLIWGKRLKDLISDLKSAKKKIMSRARPTEPFIFENLIRPDIQLPIAYLFRTENEVAQTRDKTTFGIIKSNTGIVSHPCSWYRDKYTPNDQVYDSFVDGCYRRDMIQEFLNHTRCFYENRTPKPLTWSSVAAPYFDSGCLCVALNGTNCGVKAPAGHDTRVYCLSVLLRDFQRQVWLRPAVTYLDYAHMTRVPVCPFTYILMFSYQSMCFPTTYDLNITTLLSVQCYFFGLVNKNLNCSEILPIKLDDASDLLCRVHRFMTYVNCDATDRADVAVVPFYGAGDSALVRALAYSEVAVRVLALTTYLACAALRNLPGKVLIGYQLTALLRLVAVRCASPGEPSLAVRLDVALDLASSCWLCAFLHFLTSSMRSVRSPDSLSTAEARAVLLRCALLGWALPAALSAAFFLADDLLQLRVTVGQLLFLLCNYAALLANLVMIYLDLDYYRDLKKTTLGLRVGATPRGVFADVFNFALKTSVLSGFGIVFRLIFTQIQGLEVVLGCYHALATLQAVLFFLLYTCNHKALDFWRRALLRLLSRRRRQQNTPQNNNNHMETADSTT